MLFPPSLTRAFGLLGWVEPYLEPIWAAILGLTIRLRTRTVRLLTGKSALEHICLDGWHSARMTKRVSRFLRLSRRYQALAQSTIFTVKALDSQALASQLADQEGLPPVHEDKYLTRSSLEHCLVSMGRANGVLAHALQLKATAFKADEPGHEALLEELWTLLKPDVKRSGGRRTPEWGEIGFQGEDPASDFRGMGLLGLHQLVAFAKAKPAEARAVLLDSNHPRRYYPFAATGINFTRFVLSLAEDRLLDGRMYEAFEKGFEHQDPHGDTTALLLLQRGMDVLHDTYAWVFLEFDRRWREADPPNVMAFPGIYADLQADLRQQLLNQRGDMSLALALQGY